MRITAKPLASIVSAGVTKFGVREGLYNRELFVEAAQEAFQRCPDLSPKKDIDGLFVGQMSESYEHQAHVAPMIADWLGLLPIPAFRTEAACASSGVAMRCAIYAIQSGMHDIVLVGGVEKMTHLRTAAVTEILGMASDYPFEQWHGISFPAIFAMMATAHMNKYGTTQEQLAKVAVKNHENGVLNPKAHFQKSITIDDVLKSRTVAWPLKLYDCSPISDGASCLVLTKPRLARKFTDTPVHIVGSSQAQDTLGLFEREDITTMNVTKLAAKKAYEMARVRPKEIDVSEVHDCFTIAEIMAYEALDFCKPGEGGKLIDEGVTRLGGRIPVNTSGGLKAKGHPVGATGTAQACEIYLQLTGQAGKRQVKGAEIGLTSNIGGSAATGVVQIYRRGG
ncbi:thiolase domain-containing protein [Candidatus Bathyarchaeota archaeon]|nr:thiolase domain-containing protein [Candidatus Bathyarchaeota archaeon]